MPPGDSGRGHRRRCCLRVQAVDHGRSAPEGVGMLRVGSREHTSGSPCSEEPGVQGPTLGGVGRHRQGRRPPVRASSAMSRTEHRHSWHWRPRHAWHRADGAKPQASPWLLRRREECRQVRYERSWPVETGWAPPRSERRWPLATVFFDRRCLFRSRGAAIQARGKQRWNAGRRAAGGRQAGATTLLPPRAGTPGLRATTASRAQG